MPRAGTMGEPLIAPRPAGPMRAAEPLSPRLFLRNEMGMVFGVATMGIFQLFGTAWVANLSNKVKAVADEWVAKVDTLLKEWTLLDNTVTELNTWVAKDKSSDGENQFSLEKMESTLGELKNIFKLKEKMVEGL